MLTAQKYQEMFGEEDGTVPATFQVREWPGHSPCQAILPYPIGSCRVDAVCARALCKCTCPYKPTSCAVVFFGTMK